MKLCQACTREVNTIDGYLECVKCHEVYHTICLNLNAEDINSDAVAQWSCPLCLMKQPKGDNSECLARPSTPTSLAEVSFNITRRKVPTKLDIAATASSNNYANASNYVRQSELRDIIKEEMSNAMKSLNLEIRTTFHKITEQISDFKTSIEYMSDKFDAISNELAQQKQESDKLKKENACLRTELDVLTSKLNVLDQLSRSSALEIQCLPERKSENIIQLIKQLGSAVKCSIADQDIQYCSRVAKLNPESARPRTIFAKFNSTRIRDSILSAVTRHNKEHPQDKLNTHDFGFVNEKKSPVFVIENLSAENKQLHAAARQSAKQHNYKYVWVRGGRIYMRKNEASQAIFIRNLSSLNKL